MITIAEYRLFLDDHGRPLIGYMGSVDKALAKTDDRKVKRLKREEYLRSKEKERKREYHSSAEDELTSEEELTSMAAEVESNLEQRCSPRITKQGSVPIVCLLYTS